MRALRFLAPFGLMLAIAGCSGPGLDERNPFLTVSETFGISIFDDEDVSAAAGAEAEFRHLLTLTLANYDVSAELNTSWVAWVNASSIRSADQQDALLVDGYVQLTRTVELGTAFTLSPGTFVFNGNSATGATLLRLDPATAGASENDPSTPTEAAFEIITPDAILVFSQPPVSCDTPAFFFTLDGLPFDVPPVPENVGVAFGGATGDGSVKTLAQFDVYQCDPFRPGLFFRPGGGARAANEFFEGQNIRIDFSRIPDIEDNAAFVTMGD